MDYIKGTTLDLTQVRNQLQFKCDNGGRWVPSKRTPKCVVDYVEAKCTPSSAYPKSYAIACLTQKFAHYLTEHEPELAKSCGVAK